MPQSHACVLIHLIFSTKNRHPWLTPEIEPELYPYLASIFRAHDSPALAINGVADHVHALFRLARTQRICDVLEAVKTNSSKWTKTKGLVFSTFEWQRGYGAFSIGQSSVERVKKYIERQKEHHRIRTFQEEFRLFLKKYGIEFDERYVWD
jgi:putative transposase